jgi:hypothetical protein
MSCEIKTGSKNVSQAPRTFGIPSRPSARHSSLLTRHFLLTTLFCLSIRPVVADDLTLKDGKVISGTIVGFENGMFRLETEYGFILVQKDKVSSVKITGSSVKESPQKSGARSETNESSANGPTAVATAPNPHPEPPAPPPKPPAVSRVLSVPLPAHIAEHDDGNLYVNDTFHFSLFKPPGWKIYREDMPEGKISAIVALASEDERTLLFVDRQVWSGTPDLKNDGVEANIRHAYQDYKKLSESDAEISGLSAIRHDFSGVMDGAEWHGVALRVAQGNTVYGILGMTSSETIQFQEAVLNKMVKSFHFLSQ